MSTYLGKDGIVKAAGVAIAEVMDFSVEQSADTEEDTSKGDDWRSYKTTFKTWSGEVTCRYDPTDSTGQQALAVGEVVALLLYPVNATAGSPQLSGNAIITTIGIESPLEGLCSRSFSFQGNGALTEGTAT